MCIGQENQWARNGMIIYRLLDRETGAAIIFPDWLPIGCSSYLPTAAIVITTTATATVAAAAAAYGLIRNSGPSKVLMRILDISISYT